jgi:hypothetical protein
MERKTANKKRVVTSYKNLSPEILEEVKKKYPNGWNDFVIKVEKPGGDFFYAITLDTSEVSYLIKVDVKIDNRIKGEDEDKDIFGGDDSESETNEFPDSADDSYDENDD